MKKKLDKEERRMMIKRKIEWMKEKKGRRKKIKIFFIFLNLFHFKKKYWKQKYKIISSFHSICMKFNL